MKIRRVVKYLMQQKRFITEYNTWKRKKDLENTKKIVAEFERRMNIKVRQQKKLDMVEKRDFIRGELSGKYIMKMLYSWNDGKFKKKYLRKLERN